MAKSSVLECLGAEKYYHVYNMHRLESLQAFTRLLDKCIKDNYELGATRKESNSFEMNYASVCCGNKALHLAECEDKYVIC